MKGISSTIAIIVITVLIILGLNYYFSQPGSKPAGANRVAQEASSVPQNVSSPQPAVPDNSLTAATPTDQQAGKVAVSIKNFSFNPQTVTVKAGTTIVWTNNDQMQHSIKSQSFNSQTLSPGDSFQITLTNPGTYNYSCGIHPQMMGKIIVEK